MPMFGIVGKGNELLESWSDLFLAKWFPKRNMRWNVRKLSKVCTVDLGQGSP